MTDNTTTPYKIETHKNQAIPHYKRNIPGRDAHSIYSFIAGQWHFLSDMQSRTGCGYTLWQNNQPHLTYAWSKTVHYKRQTTSKIIPDSTWIFQRNKDEIRLKEMCQKQPWKEKKIVKRSNLTLAKTNEIKAWRASQLCKYVKINEWDTIK